MRRLCALVVLVLALVGVGHAQRPLRGGSNELVGYQFIVNLAAPHCLVLPQAGGDVSVQFEVAQRLNKLGVNALVIPPTPVYTDPLSSPDSILQDLRHRIDLLRVESKNPIVVMGAGRSASVALMAAAKDLRIKAAVVASPGEYFDGKEYVKRHVTLLCVPTQVLCTKKEGKLVRDLLEVMPRQLLFISESLSEPGFQNMVGQTKASGESWLAVSVFFSEQFSVQPR